MHITRIRSTGFLLVTMGAIAGCGHHRFRGDVAAANQVDVSSGGQVAPAPAAAPAPPALVATGSAAGLTRVTSDANDEFAPQLSPDGSTLVYVSSTAVDDGNGNTVAQTTILGTDPSNGAAHTIYTSQSAGANFPAFMPSGALVYAAMTTGTQALVRSLTKTPNAAFSVIVDGRTFDHPCWPSVSARGDRIAFEANANGIPSIVTAAIDGSRLTVLGPGHTPSWSADGRRLVFSRDVGSGQEIMMMDAATGGNLTQITSNGCVSGNPRFSLNGQHIVFESNCGWDREPGGSADSTWNIFAVKTDGTGLTQLTSGAGESAQPFWGTDGYIYFESNYGGTASHDIWRIQPVGELDQTPSLGAKPPTVKGPA